MIWELTFVGPEMRLGLGEWIDVDKSRFSLRMKLFRATLA